LEEKESREVTSETMPNVSVRNIYFEITLAEWISGIVTEKGMLKPKDVLPIVKEMADYVRAWLI
jgi:translation initiation factor 2B subunit (eIF-2B alpha/beta/delta family)